MTSVVLLAIAVISLIVLLIASFWKIFEKCGRQGWEAIIPIYSNYVLVQIIGKPTWWFIVMLIPYVGIVFSIWSLNLLVKGFNKPTSFTIGCIFLPFIFLPMLAFGDAQWQGTTGESFDHILDA